MTRAESFENITKRMLDIYKAKNSDYGGAFTTIRSKYPESIVVRLWDKLLRLEQLMEPGYEPHVHDEKIEDTLIDLANYACMELVEREIETQEEIDARSNICVAETYMLNQKPRRYLVWALDHDGITEYYNWKDANLNNTDADLYFNHDTNRFELELELSYDFADTDRADAYLGAIAFGLNRLAEQREHGGTYKLQWYDAFNMSDVITGATIREVMEKYRFFADNIRAYLNHGAAR